MSKFFYIIVLTALTSIDSTAQGGLPSTVHNSISIQYDLTPGTKNSFFSATASSNQDLLNGVSYNQGNALRFSIYSSAPYYINLSSLTSSYIPGSSALSLHPADISNYIFYKIIDNTTGGTSISSGNSRGNMLGTTERVIIRNCPGNITANNPAAAKAKGFGLLFRVFPGYSLPPGNYSTQIIITATYE